MADLEFQLAIRDLGIAQARNDLLRGWTWSTATAPADKRGRRSAFDDLFRDPAQIIGRSVGGHPLAIVPPKPSIGGPAGESPDRAEPQKEQEIQRRSMRPCMGCNSLAADSGAEQVSPGPIATTGGTIRVPVGRRTSTDVLLAPLSWRTPVRQINAFVSYEITQVRLARATARCSAAGMYDSNPRLSKQVVPQRSPRHSSCVSLCGSPRATH